ncbi:armadillo-type protein [Infundibulicybe gibba]|nr:armadillo-type protein [Infundibulicybe gibba]
MEPVALQATAAKAVRNVDPDSPEIVDQKVKALLNELTMEKFDPISDQIISWANRSEKERDGRTLLQVIRLVFEKATDEATWPEMCARLCRKMMEKISPSVQDDGIQNSEGKPIAGGQLFRKYLLNRCQEDFERGWVAKEATAAAAATKAMEGQAAKAVNDKNKEGETGDEIVLYSDEYYAAQKAERQGLGLIEFIGELFKLQMLTERIMHECVKKLLGNVNNPEEEEIKSLCKLLTTVGALLDVPKARAHMDVYFQRMKELTKSQNVSSRMQFMLQDVIELRERKWVTRNLVAAPTTIHEAAAKGKAAQEKGSYQQQTNMSRGGSRRDSDRNDSSQQIGPDGWAVTGNNSGPPRPPPNAGDLSNFGKISKPTPMTFGPTSIFNKEGKRESRTSSSLNMFSMLRQGSEVATPDGRPARGSHPHSRKTSVDISHAGAPEPAPQKRIVLQSRSKPTDAETAPTPEPEASSDEVQEMSAEEADKKIAEDSKELFAVRNLDEAEVYFTNLPAQHHSRLIAKLASSGVESKAADAQLVAEFFGRAASRVLCSAAAFEDGLAPTAEIIDDIAIDAPKAFELFAQMVRVAGLDEERRTRLASKSLDSDRLLPLLS